MVLVLSKTPTSCEDAKVFKKIVNNIYEYKSKRMYSTFNRRPFIKNLILCYEKSNISKTLLEWIIIDDGTDKVEDYFKIWNQWHYYYKDKMTIGQKKNICHEKATGEIIVYMDDDDYYPPERIEHAVSELNKSNKLC